ncbi:MAG: hypothetical protein HGN29_02390 [Asgard group archaeon]|nr:hypothetical protein [Asgard group archaeon]
MKFQKLTFSLLISILMLFIVGNTNQNLVSAFEIGTIEDKNDWVISSKITNYSNDFNAKMVFAFENETLGIGLYPYLTFHTDFNVPFNLTGYLNKDLKKENATYGIQVSGYPGNITLGLNGTIIVKTPITDTFFIEIEEGTAEIKANFFSFIGENISLPINFNSMKFTINDPDIANISSISLEIDPEMYLEGSISLSAIVDDQELEWKTSDEFYFDSVNINKDMNDFALFLQNITLNFQDLSLRIKRINTSIILGTELGNFDFDYDINLQNVEWVEGQQTAGEFLVFLIDTLINMDDLVIFMTVFRAPISLYSTLIAIVLFSSIVYVKRKKIKPK